MGIDLITAGIMVALLCAAFFMLGYFLAKAEAQRKI
jgi:hypothetical protein